jgi:cytochrome c oxidase subunit 2
MAWPRFGVAAQPTDRMPAGGGPTQLVGDDMRLAARTILGLVLTTGILAAGLLALPTTGLAAEPTNWGLGMQAAASPVKGYIEELHDLLLYIIVAITLFVLALMIYVVGRFRAAHNPNPSRTSHNTLLEVAWTVIPVLILVVIAIPSFRLLYFQDRAPTTDLTVKVTGHQWYWSYEYQDHDQAGVKFESRMVPTDELRPGQRRLLDVDNELVVPVGKNVRLLVTGTDVIHSYFMPSLGVQKYAIPGRTLETWFRVDRPGVYYGQCNQICGTQHAFMPSVVRAVPEAEFNAWVVDAKRRFAANGQATHGVQVALGVAE